MFRSITVLVAVVSAGILAPVGWGHAQSVTPQPYDEALFGQRLAEAQAYAMSSDRVRDVAVEKYRAVLAIRPGHPDNIDIETEVAALLHYRMKAKEQPRSKEAVDVYRRIIADYGADPKDIRVLQAKIHLYDLRRMLEGQAALAAAREVYAAIIDMPDDEVQVPDAWRYEDGRRLSALEWDQLRARRIEFVKKGAAGTYVSSYVFEAGTVLEQIAVLKRLSHLRADNKVYQDCVAGLIKHFSESVQEQIRSDLTEVLDQGVQRLSVPSGLPPAEVGTVTGPGETEKAQTATPLADRTPPPGRRDVASKPWGWLGLCAVILAAILAIVVARSRRRRGAT